MRIRTWTARFLAIAIAALSLSLNPLPAKASTSVPETASESYWYYNYETGEGHWETANDAVAATASQTVRTRPAYCPNGLPNNLGSEFGTMAQTGDHGGVLAHSYPYCAAGMLELHVDHNNDGVFDDEYSAGTAFLVAEDIILTAAHCIFVEDSSKKKAAFFFPAQNGMNDRYREDYKTTVIASLMSSAYIQSQDLKQDWAICQIKHDRGNTFGWFGLSSSAGVHTNLALSLLGYPGNEAGEPPVVDGYQYKSTGKVSSILNTTQFRATNYIRPGYSGGPMYDSNGLVYGIASQGISGPNNNDNTIAIQFPDSLFNRIIEWCDASAARWS